MHPSDVVVSVSQPLPALMSQLPKPGMHDTTAQAPALHPGTPLAAVQVVPHAPQLATLLAVSMHPPLQHERPIGQPRAALHPGTQVLPMQRLPMGQCVSMVHGTHACVVTSQRSGTEPASGEPIPAQSPSLRQPATQSFIEAAQYWPSGQVSLVGVQRGPSGATSPFAVASPSASPPRSLPAPASRLRAARSRRSQSSRQPEAAALSTKRVKAVRRSIRRLPRG